MPNTKTRLTDPSLTPDLSALNYGSQSHDDVMTSQHHDVMTSHDVTNQLQSNHGHQHNNISNALQSTMNGLTKGDLGEMPT